MVWRRRLDSFAKCPSNTWHHGVIGTLLNKLPGDIWEIAEIEELKQSIEKEELTLLGIESVAIHDAIKAGTEERDHYIDHYIQTIKNLSACGIHLICYSFKPILVGQNQSFMKMRMAVSHCCMTKQWLMGWNLAKCTH